MGVPLPPDSPTVEEPPRVATPPRSPPSASTSSHSPSVAAAIARSHAALLALPALNDPRYSIIDPPTSSTLLPPPPAEPFDAPATTTTTSQAWDRWLSERNHRRQQIEAANGFVHSQSLDFSRSRRTDMISSSNGQRIGTPERAAPPAGESLSLSGAVVPRTLGSASATANSLQSSLETSRQTLEQVRQRLDETRERVVAATARVEGNTESLLARLAGERAHADRLLVESRERLEWSTTFVTRIDTLITHLSAITDRASSLSTETSSLTSTSTSTSTFSSSTLPLVTSSNPVESPSSATATDALRVTVRQLVGASQRVSAAIERHRASVAAGNRGVSDVETAPLLRTDTPLRVSLPPSTTTTTSNYPLPSTPVTSTFSSPPRTSPNPSGLLLPTATGTYPLTTSPAPLTPSPQSLDLSPPPLITAPPAPSIVLDPLRESYPGERRQLLRLASLQRDIAERGAQLRELRGRADELAREQRAFATVTGEGEEGEGGEAKEEEEEEEEPVVERAPVSRPSTLEERRAAAEAKLLPGKEGGWVWTMTAEEKARDFAIWSRCGR